MNIPNKITLSRILLVGMMLLALFALDIVYLVHPFAVPVFTDGAHYSINLVYLIAVIVFVIAAATDALDGYLARKWHQVTSLGKFLDPIADKLLVDSFLLYLMLPHFGLGTLTIPLWCVIVMILRDLVVDALRFIAASKGTVLAANIFGKIKTVAQVIAIPMVLINDWPFSYFDGAWGYGRIALIAIYLATAASLLSGIIYVVQNRAVLKEGKGQ